MYFSFKKSVIVIITIIVCTFSWFFVYMFYLLSCSNRSYINHPIEISLLHSQSRNYYPCFICEESKAERFRYSFELTWHVSGQARSHVLCLQVQDQSPTAKTANLRQEEAEPDGVHPHISVATCHSFN